MRSQKITESKLVLLLRLWKLNIFFFQIHGSTRGYNESPSVRTTLYIPINNVPWRFLHRHGKVLSSTVITRRSLPQININFEHIEKDYFLVTCSASEKLQIFGKQSYYIYCTKRSAALFFEDRHLI